MIKKTSLNQFNDYKVWKRHQIIQKSLKFIKNSQNRKIFEMVYQIKEEIVRQNKMEQQKNELQKKKKKYSAQSRKQSKQRKKNQKGIQKTKRKVQLDEQQQIFDQEYFPGLLKKLLSNLYEKAQILKTRQKQIRYLPIDQKFISLTFHQCPFCPVKFQKPCSLGGHISKLHKKQKDEVSMIQKNQKFKSPTKRRQ